MKDGENIIGNRARVKVVKNKVAPPFREAEFDIMYGEGVSRESELIELGAKYGILTKSGAWILWGDEKLGQGREASKQYLRDHKEISKKLEKQIVDASKAVAGKKIEK